MPEREPDQPHQMDRTDPTDPTDPVDITPAAAPEWRLPDPGSYRSPRLSTDGTVSFCDRFS